ncbi:MAG: O-methyltransferase [Erysipelotrichaceae bacterium]|nr:O-methyltransferase [Erysipelotrichaceae bacterium]
MVELTNIEIDALKRNIPIMQKEGLTFMIDKLNEIQASTCLEIGSAIGYSAMMMCLNVNDLKIDTIEINEDKYNEALNNIQQYQLNERISIHLADALTFDTNQLSYQPYDCLFIDAAKAQYQKFFEKYINYVKKDGIVIVDNLDFHGMIYDIDHIKNRNTKQLVKKIKRFKDWIFNHEDYDATYYHIGDGICIITRKE